jgi:hypothetical protein
MKLWKAGIKPIEVFVFNKDTFGVYLQPWAVDAFQEEFNKKDWTGLYEFEAESFASEGPYSDYECGQCREYGDYDPGEAPAAEEECDCCGDSICIGCYEADYPGLCMRCDGFMSENDYFDKYGGIYEDGRPCPLCELNNMAENACGTPGNDMCNDCCSKSGGCGHCMSE